MAGAATYDFDRENVQGTDAAVCRLIDKETRLFDRRARRGRPARIIVWGLGGRRQIRNFNTLPRYRAPWVDADDAKLVIPIREGWAQPGMRKARSGRGAGFSLGEGGNLCPRSARNREHTQDRRGMKRRVHGDLVTPPPPGDSGAEHTRGSSDGPLVTRKHREVGDKPPRLTI